MPATMTAALGFTLFPTALGTCGIVWGEHGVLGLQLPEPIEAATRARLMRRHGDAAEQAPPAAVQQAIAGIVALLGGDAADLQSVPLDMHHVPPFDRRVYEIARRIPAGRTRTYGDIATALGQPGAAREVGQALGRNPFAIIVPCHRVLAAGGKPGGFSARGGVHTKLRLLAIEQAVVGDGADLFAADASPADPAPAA